MQYIKLYEDYIFESINFEIIKNPNDEDFNAAVELSARVLMEEGQNMGLSNLINYIKYNSDKRISIIAKLDGKVVGALLCKEETILNMMNSFGISFRDVKIDESEFNDIKDELCIQGFVLAIDKEYRFSRLIFKLVEQLDKSYYGLIINQDDELEKNINYLRKGAKLIISSKIYGRTLNVYFGKF
jgi:hypothetical protein